MEDTIKQIELIDPVASAGSVDGPPIQANQPAQRKILRPLSQQPLAKKPTIPTRPLVRRPLVKKPITKPTPKAIADIEGDLGEPKKAWERYRSTNGRDAVYFYLEAVFAVVTRWQQLNCAIKKISGGSSPSARRSTDEARAIRYRHLLHG